MRSSIRRVVVVLLIMTLEMMITAVSALAQGPCDRLKGKQHEPSFCNGGAGYFKQGFPIKWTGTP